MSSSACLILWNEQEMLPYCLHYLDSVPEITEICIVDSESIDGTRNVLDQFFASTRKRFFGKTLPFVNFSEQRNAVLDLATEDWIVMIDADETYTPQLGELLQWAHSQSEILAFRIPTLVLCRDRRHWLADLDDDPHVRVWRNGAVRYQGDVHEKPMINGCDVHTDKRAPGVLNTYESLVFEGTWMKHAQLLKSDVALRQKGRRWKPFFAQSAEQKILIDEDWWVRCKHSYSTAGRIVPLPESLYDATTLWSPDGTH